MMDERDLANRAIGNGRLASRAGMCAGGDVFDGTGEAIPIVRFVPDGSQVWAVAKPADDRVALFVQGYPAINAAHVLELSRTEARAIRDSLTEALGDFDRAAEMAGDAA